MKKFLLATTAVVALAAPAVAADLPVKAPPVAVVAAYSWTGCYVGGHAGGLWGRTRWENAAGNDAAFVRDDTGRYSNFVGGGQIGCNVQSGNWVFGIEGDFSWTRVNQFQIHDIVNLDEIRRTRFDWLSTVRGRIGFTRDRIHVYGTGGLALTRIRVGYENYTDATRTVVEEVFESTINSGWVAGVGGEFAFTSNWIGRVEYLHYGFSRVAPPGAILGGQQQYARPSLDVVRAGLSYKFGGPVVARY